MMPRTQPHRAFGRAHLLALFVAASVSTWGIYKLLAADLEAPRANDRQVTLAVTSLMRREHLLKHPLDDEISNRAIESFMKTLDPLKLYFYQSDVDEFTKNKDDIDDMIKRGDITLGYTIFNRLLDRIDERVKQVEILTAPEYKFDFTKDEEFVTDRDKLKFPTNSEEALDIWRKRIKYDLLSLKADETVGEEAREKLRRRYTSFGKRMRQTDSDELLEMFLTAVTTSYDPHTTYMSPSTLENFRIIMSLELEGIGAALQSIDGQTIVSKIIPGGAADKQGKLKEEDRIVSVGQGDEEEMVDVVDMKLNDVVKLIRGKAGTVVKLGVKPEGSEKSTILEITRAKIELKDSEARGEILEAGKRADGTPYKVGVIDLPSFYMDMEGARAGRPDYKSTTRDVKKLLEGFNAEGVDGVILDLRRNGGGSLTEAINLTGLFIESGPVVQVKDSDERVQHYDDFDRSMSWKGPLVVLTSKFSASASEILAGAIQDYKRGLIVGDESTHGKGTVQSLLDLGTQLFRVAEPPNLGALKITMQQFYRPNGDSTQQRGVLADVVLPSITDHMDVSESDLDFPVVFGRVPAAKYHNYDMTSPNIVGELNTLSKKRQEASEDFQKLNKKIEKYVEQKSRKAVSLNEEKFMARRAEFDADKEDEKTFEEQEQGNGEFVVKRDFYFNEALEVMTDYLSLLKDHKIAARVD